jgi:hypothetical protein
MASKAMTIIAVCDGCHFFPHCDVVPLNRPKSAAKTSCRSVFVFEIGQTLRRMIVRRADNLTKSGPDCRGNAAEFLFTTFFKPI